MSLRVSKDDLLGCKRYWAKVSAMFCDTYPLSILANLFFWEKKYKNPFLEVMSYEENKRDFDFPVSSSK